MGPLFPVFLPISFSDTFFYLVKKSIPRHFQDDRQCLSLPGYFVPPRSYSGLIGWLGAGWRDKRIDGRTEILYNLAVMSLSPRLVATRVDADVAVVSGDEGTFVWQEEVPVCVT